jgi:hypothetical protein
MGFISIYLNYYNDCDIIAFRDESETGGFYAMPIIDLPTNINNGKIISTIAQYIKKLNIKPMIFTAGITDNKNHNGSHAIFGKYIINKAGKPMLLFNDINEGYIPDLGDKQFTYKIPTYTDPLLYAIRLRCHNILIDYNHMTGKTEYAFDYINDLMSLYNKGLKEFPAKIVNDLNRDITKIITGHETKKRKTKGGKNKNMNIVLFVFVLLCVISLLVVIIVIIKFCKYSKVKQLNNYNI